MTFNVNIYQLRISTMNNNASIIIGPGYHNSHASTTKLEGNNSTAGDHAPASALMKNTSFDPDVNDQTEIANSDNIYTGPQGNPRQEHPDEQK
ncbi:hypothetical protein GCM10011391_35590 [Pullulanibacillus camelliae]|uniref:Spore germination protein n=1 Tax=Pullulanibacillus camelliae TaxID=1707096 RepID=A0A8J2YMR3_9BACL|nr:spore germination protein [Pullulanibacillus camelliae]GGE53603.1 hypothetical protein GCM10011391_35590 [Pullulanibacillus camelliae]